MRYLYIYIYTDYLGLVQLLTNILSISICVECKCLGVRKLSGNLRGGLQGYGKVHFPVV